MRRLLANDALSQLGERTFWHDLQEWFGCEFVGGDYATLADTVITDNAGLIIRNATWFPPIKASERIPTISLLQDIFTDGPIRKMQEDVICRSRTVCNSLFTAKEYGITEEHVIPLPVDFSLFEPGNPMGLQQALSLPDRCTLWVGACHGAAGNVKGWDIFLQIVRLNPDLHFVAVLKDAMPESFPPNLRCYVRLTQEELVRVIGACRVGLCTSRTESQHLAGIEMGACGLPLVVPNVGTYWKRGDTPWLLVRNPEPHEMAHAIRAFLRLEPHEETRAYWYKEFSKQVVRKQWERLVEEVEGLKPQAEASI